MQSVGSGNKRLRKCAIRGGIQCAKCPSFREGRAALAARITTRQGWHCLTCCLFHSELVFKTPVSRNLIHEINIAYLVRLIADHDASPRRNGSRFVSSLNTRSNPFLPRFDRNEPRVPSLHAIAIPRVFHAMLSVVFERRNPTTAG